MAERLAISQLMDESGVAFGTSGARGLVTAMTDRVCAAYTLAFLQHLKGHGSVAPGTPVALAGDLRPSTPQILQAVAAGVRAACHPSHFLGFIPSPAAKLYGLANGYPAVMVTGSHIPKDRNGLEFTTATGEITKTDEAGMRAQIVDLPDLKPWLDEKARPKLLGDANPLADILNTRRISDVYLDGIRLDRAALLAKWKKPQSGTSH